MPNLFKIDFIQGKTDATDYNQVKHSLIDSATNRAIISLSISADLDDATLAAAKSAGYPTGQKRLNLPLTKPVPTALRQQVLQLIA